MPSMPPKYREGSKELAPDVFGELEDVVGELDKIFDWGGLDGFFGDEGRGLRDIGVRGLLGDDMMALYCECGAWKLGRT